ncbi:MAG: NYN domain-containing protein [Defluviitaleaceae bacterium]|nr:NYN domain-containing protein [Defluviitaleaceae bacterium]MCL2837052.1 NYN domain-containing protein [Defluviitaleaceae bacterium]
MNARSNRFSTSYLLVDGYNIIYAWKHLRRLADGAGGSLDAARQTLVDILANYRGVRHQEIIVVFDAHKVNGGIGSVERRNGVFMVYTREAETADEYIERAAGAIMKENIRVRVATSDYLEQIIIMGQGAARLFAEDLQREVEEAERDIRTRINEPKPIHKNRLFDNLDPKTAELLEKIRLGEE